MLASLIQSAPLYDAAWWLAVLWLFRTLCLWSFFWANCPCCEASGCDICTQDEGAVTLTVTLTISGVTDPISGDCPFYASCTNCESYNDTHIFDLDYDNDPGGDLCYSKIGEPIGSAPCGGIGFSPAVSLEISSIDGSGDITITLTISDNYMIVTASYVVAAQIDCSNFGPVSMTIDSAVPKPDAWCCNPSAIAIDLSLST
jgi:hypothetical protein